MSVRVAREFQGRWSCFWATSYSLELELFDEYLFRRLGEPPLNATLLVDFRRLAASLARLGPEDSRRLQRANRDYLLRGVPIGGSFHPKTYFLGSAKEGVLLVGSGNLTLRGIEEGHELFARLDSREPDDLGSIRGWRDWMDAIVDRAADREVSYRWLDLKQRTPWLEGPAEGSCFVSNLEQSLIEQLAAPVESPVDELHVLAPYYDRHAKALRALLDRLRPRQLDVYVGAGTSVEGPALEQLLVESTAQVSVHSFDPHEFVHAKLIGIVAGETGRLLSGSANLSQAALTASLADAPWANVEAGVLIEASPNTVRAAFASSRLELCDASLGQLAVLEFEADEEAPQPSLLLRAARLLDDGRVEVAVDGEAPEKPLVTAGLEARPLTGDRSEGPLALPEGGVLVWLCDAGGTLLSNRVPLDEPTRLRGWLEERTSSGDRPRELDTTDYDTPVGRMLLYLHERCIFDIEETSAATRARRLANEDAAESDGSWDFLDDLLKEELRYDPRVEHYRRFALAGLPEEDEVLALLRTMLERTPEHRGLRAIGGVPEDDDGKEPKQGAPWTPERRLQVRLFNVLERWCGALNDPRFAWIDPASPARNYSTLLVALAECWELNYLPEHRVVRLLTTLLSGFVRSERVRGHLLLLDEDEREQTLARLPDEAKMLAGALAYAALREQGDWRSWVFELQPALVTSLELGVLEVGGRSASIVQRLVQEEATPTEIEERLFWASEFIDDEHWCRKQERDLGLERVTLTKESFNRRFGITLSIDGSDLDDPRIVSLVRQALVYRHVDGAVVELGSTRLSVHLDDFAFAKANDLIYQSRERITQDLLVTLERQGVSWARTLETTASAAS
jgi:hypothetical protein